MLTPPRAHRSRRLVTGLAVVGLVAAGAAACTDDPAGPAGPFRLVSFDSCDDALAGLRAAARASVGTYGFSLPVGRGIPLPAEGAAEGDRVDAPGAPPGFAAPPVPGPVAEPGGPDYSGTNVHEQGVDEPDLVKTDGKRIVTVSAGRLSIVDVTSRQLVGVVSLRGDGEQPGVRYAGDLLLAGDHALVFSNDYGYAIDDRVITPPPMPDPVIDIVPGAEPDPAKPDPAKPDAARPAEPALPRPVVGASLLLVDLNSARVLSRARADGYVVDARQVGPTVRLVLRSSPRLEFPAAPAESEQARLAANRAVIDAAGIDAWAPRLEVTTGDQTVRTQVPCREISRPATYSGTNMLTVLTFDASRDALDDGSPVSIVADGDTVYSNGTSLYVASNQAWMRAVPDLAFFAPAPTQPRTEIYRFDTTQERPRFVAGGSVPGSLINQYAMSEWEGRLRVATTTEALDRNTPAQSGVHVLATVNGKLVEVGSVEGLGKGERIYAVRFVGPVGYVVTFRQTDPLYTVDLRDPTRPVVRGALKIPGYSAYLHPVGVDRLIGIGQDATDEGRVLGTQVSLFDVADLDDPTRVATYTLRGAYSEAEVDPHAFLYWPRTGLLVVPLDNRIGVRSVGPGDIPTGPASGALVLRLRDDKFTEIGFVTHPASPVSGYAEPIRRSLVTDGGATLWTVSGGGLLATDTTTLTRLAWIGL